MKKIILLTFLFPLLLFAQQQTVTYSINPPAFEENQSVTITINGSSINESTWGVVGNALYMWAWSYDLNDSNSMDCPTNGSWTSSSETNKFTYNSGDDTYTMTIVPTTFFSRVGIGRFGLLVKAKDGTGDKKSQDIYQEVGAFSVTLINPDTNNGIIFVNSGGFQTLLAQNGNGNATYQLFANGSLVTTQTTNFFNYNFTNITENKYCELVATQNSSVITKYFTIVVNPGANTQAMNSGLEDGINYNSGDQTKATLVLNAPLKDFVYVAGSFNNWQPTTAYAMKKDATSGKYWLELTGLTSGQIYTYQYWVFEATPLPNSPKYVKTADPFSTLVLSPFDDPWIPAVSYPNLPAYPVGQEREVTVLQTAQPAYNWQVTNFSKPKKEDLVVYEVLIRDFDANRNFQDLINKMDYFKNLNVNAIQLMPIMEYEGNESWGYNTAFHMALDKYYGTSDKLKELVDVCHQNGIAVILDIALNHAFGRNPMNRMWMLDSDKDGWGDPSSENPYFNVAAMHSYNVGSDFNHSTAVTKYYSKRVVKHWIEEYKIDGFRWDLTKGFTQNCPSNVAGGQEACTGNYQADRVAILKDYADYSWSLDPSHYVIFEHLGGDTEEAEWGNYRLGEGKGIMLWGKMVDQYNQLTMGFSSNSDISRMGHLAHTGFNGKRVIGYAESHDEERLMYKNLMYGINTNSSHNVRDLHTALSRMSALGAVSLTIPGPKMIWHFGALGMDNSIFTCTNGTVNDASATIPGDCKLATKPQPQWTNDWMNVSQRRQIYNDWSKLNALKIQEPVFEGDYSITSGTLTPKIYIWNDALTSTQLKNVVVLANFEVTTQSIVPNFPYTGTWYNLMDNTTFEVTNTTTPISIAAGQFKIYGNKPSTLSIDNELVDGGIQLYPNPTSSTFKLNVQAEKVQIFDVSGKLVKQFTEIHDNTYNVSELIPAMYFVRIQTNNGVNTQRLVIQN